MVPVFPVGTYRHHEGTADVPFHTHRHYRGTTAVPFNTHRHNRGSITVVVGAVRRRLSRNATEHVNARATWTGELQRD